MPKQNTDISGGNIDHEIGELVSQLEEATQKLADEIEVAARPDDEFDLKATLAAIEQPKAKPEVDSALDSQVGAMIADASAAVKDVPPKDVGAIDSQLAELADEMLDGDFDDLDRALASAEAAEAAPKPVPTPSPAHEEGDLLDGDFDDLDQALAHAEVADKQPAPKPKAPEPRPAPAAMPREKESSAPPAAETPAPKPAPKPVPTPAAKPAPATKAEADTEPARAVTHTESAPKDRHASGRRLPGGLSKLPLWRAGKVAFAIAEKASKPLDNKPAGVRDVAGWLAAVTLFNAFAVWVFLLIARGPAPGTSDEPAVDLVGQNTTASVDADAIE